MSVNRKYAGVLALALVPLAAMSVNRLTLQPESRVWINGGSTVRDYKCTATTIDANIIAPENSASVPLGMLVTSAEVSIPVAQLDCGNGTMNDHMRKALKAKESPTVSFKLNSYKENMGELLLTGTLTIAGTEKPVQLLGTLTEDRGTVRATAKAQINMSEWGVKPPSLMMGTMKVKDAVTINVDVLVKR